MDEVPIAGIEDADRLVKGFMAQYDVPAYVRRALQVEAAYGQLLGRCRARREEWLALVRTRLGLLHALAGDWAVLRPWLADVGQLDVLRELYGALQPQLRGRVRPTTSARTLRRALAQLKASIERFNRRWDEFLVQVDRSAVNELRDKYNRYYLLEKECAMRSARLARQGFRRLEPLSLAELTAQFPPLPVPRLTGENTLP